MLLHQFRVNQTNKAMGTSSLLTETLDIAASERHLPSSYVGGFIKLVAPLIDENLIHAKSTAPQIIGIQGCQGSGKTTLCEFIKLYIEYAHDAKVEICSIDDFYLSKQERQTLSKTTHHLLATRGVPGTHDTSLILKTFEAFKNRRSQKVPVFKKQIDDRADPSEWQVWATEPDILIFEGWCVGIPAQAASALSTAINDLEKDEDSDGLWREHVNNALAKQYQEVFQYLDSMLVIQAPSFDCVYEWRLQQEQRMIEKMQQRQEDYSQAMTPAQIERFISHYQRLTEHGFRALPSIADATLYLNNDHSFARTQVNTKRKSKL